jgi:FkbM family methyltransferase
MKATTALRTRVFRVGSRMHLRIGALPAGDRILKATEKALTGPITVAYGPGVGIRLHTRGLPLHQAHAYHLVHGSVEVCVQEALRRTVAPGAVVYDIGANLGFFALLAKRFAGDAGRVIAFEPSPQTLELLNENLALNPERVEVVEAAVSDHDGRGTLLQVSDHGWSHLDDRGHHPQTVGTHDVQVIRLDTEIAAGRLPAPDVIKLDIEGSEIAALTGLTETLATHGPTIICELHSTNDEVADLLTAAGYVVENLESTLPVREAGPIHILARPASPRA